MAAYGSLPFVLSLSVPVPGAIQIVTQMHVGAWTRRELRHPRESGDPARGVSICPGMGARR